MFLAPILTLLCLYFMLINVYNLYMPVLRKLYCKHILLTIAVFLSSLILAFNIVYAADQNSEETQVDHEFIGGGSAMGWNADDEYWSYALPFSFNFYGVDYSTVYVSSNGYVGFVDSTVFENYSLSISMTSPSPLIFALGCDLSTINTGSYSADNDIFITDNGNNIIIRWQAEYYASGSSYGSGINAELILYDSGNFKINYGDNIYTYPFSDDETITVGISDGVSQYTASIYNDGDNSDLRFDNPDSLYWVEGSGGNDGPSNNVFKEDTRCHWIKPPAASRVNMYPTIKDGVRGIELTWVQYDSDKIDILIDDGTGGYPWKLRDIINDGHEFLPNVATSQSIRIKPYNHCSSGNLGDVISYNTSSGSWSNNVLGTSAPETTPINLDTGFSNLTVGLLTGTAFLIYGIVIYASNPRKIAIKDFEKKACK